MNIFRRSKAEDAVDGYNHIWSVVFLLVLSLITWLILLSPSLSTPAPQQSKRQQSIPMPRYSANCWCPSQFTGSMVMYVNSFCGGAFNQAVNGNSKIEDAVLYEMLSDVIPILRESTLFMPSTKRTSNSELMEESEKSAKKETAISRFREFVSIKTPLVIFIFAICLKLPHVIWTLLSGCAGINISQTLETARQGQSLDKDSRHQLKQDLVLAVSQSAKSTSYSTALLYLLFKVLMCVAVVAELVYVHNTLLPEVTDLDNEINFANTRLEKNNSTVLATSHDFSNKVLLCEFSIRQLSVQHEYIVQCVFTSQASTPPSQVTETSPMKELPSVYMYKALFTALFIFFFILFLINVINLFMWIFKLVLGPCRHRVTPNSNLPLDVYLLLYMAQDNVGHLVAIDLSVNFAVGNRTDKKDELEERL